MESEAVSKINSPKPIESEKPVDAMAEVVKLTAKVSDLEQKIAELEKSTKVERVITQLVIDREGKKYTARAKILLRSTQKSEEMWQDVTENFTQEELEDLLNGA